MRLLHTYAGDHWRDMLRRPDGTVSDRIRSLQVEQAFWNQQMASGPPKPDSYAAAVWKALRQLTASSAVSSVLEIGPGWGNYTFLLGRAFACLGCVDISPDNLTFLAEKARQESISLVTFCSAWETAETGRWDLVFGYNCLYRVTEPELFLLKMNRTARKLCVIGMNRPPELPWLPALEEAGLAIHYTRQGCRELLNVLTSLGLKGKLVTVPNHRSFRYSDREALLDRAGQFLLEPCPREKLWKILEPFHRQEADGSLVCEYAFLSQLLVWAPVNFEEETNL